MKTFKKALSIILGLAMMLSCVAGMHVSAEGASSFTVTVGNGTAKPGDTVEIPVTLSNVVGGYTALGFAIDYDPAVLTLAEKVAVDSTYEAKLEAGDITDAVVFEQSENLTDDPYNLIWAFVDGEAVTTDGVVATLKFTVNANATAGATTTVAIAAAAKSGSMNGNADVAVEYVNGTVTVKAAECAEGEHVAGEWIIDTPATENASGTRHTTCTVCGKEINDIDPRIIRFRSGNLELSNSIGVQFKVRAEYFDIYDDIYVSFSFKGEESTLHEYTYDATGNAVFTFTGTTPLTVNETVTATIYGVYGDELYVGTVDHKGVVPYGIRTYCESKIDSSSDLNKTLIVDMLNYCAAYEAYDTAQNGTVYEEAANAWLTDAQKAYGTSELRELVSHQKLPIKEIDNPTVAFKAGALNLVSTVEMRIAIDELNYTDLTILAEAVDTEGNVIDEWTITPENTTFITSGNRTYFYFDQLYATQFSTPIQFTIYRGGAVVSNTLQYSVESYCYAKKEDAVLGNLVKAIAKYGDAAYASYNP